MRDIYARIPVLASPKLREARLAGHSRLVNHVHNIETVQHEQTRIVAQPSFANPFQWTETCYPNFSDMDVGWVKDAA